MMDHYSLVQQLTGPLPMILKTALDLVPCTDKWLLLFNISKEEDLVQAHPEGEVEIVGDQPAEAVPSLDTFAGKVHVKWAPEAAVSSLGLMPFFIEFLKTSGLFDKWVEDCPLHYTSGNAPEKRDVLGTLLLSV